MAAVFTSRANFIARASLAGAGLALAGAGVVAYGTVHSSFRTGVGIEVEQPVPFSHEHHVSGLGIDCRYCHTSVEDSAFAGMPATQTCMTCHAQLWTDAALLEPVRESFRSGVPLRWRRVHDLPDYAYFDHSIHLAGGIGCASCHGRVDRMPLVRKTATLHMRWCIDCHRDPAPHVRPAEALFDMAWQPGASESRADAARAAPGAPSRTDLLDCSICHR